MSLDSIQSELIEFYNYTAETHYITTKDGYILRTFRCNSKTNNTTNKKAVIIKHGIMASSDDFCMTTPSHSLGKLIATKNPHFFIIEQKNRKK